VSSPPRWVEHYLAIPFVDRGRTERGVDCFGLVRLVMARQAEITLHNYGFVDVRDRGSIGSEIAAAKADRSLWTPVSIGGARPLDVVPMVDDVGVDDGHVGIMVTHRHVLHTEFASGPVCLDISHPSVVHRFQPQHAPLVYRHRDLCT